jgi:hypothetical protein
VPELQCPTCHAVLGDRDIDDGWCDRCGKAIPQSLVSAGLKERHQKRRAGSSAGPRGLVAEPEPAPRAAGARSHVSRVVGVVGVVLAVGVLALVAWAVWRGHAGREPGGVPANTRPAASD